MGFGRRNEANSRKQIVNVPEDHTSSSERISLFLAVFLSVCRSSCAPLLASSGLLFFAVLWSRAAVVPEPGSACTEVRLGVPEPGSACTEVRLGVPGLGGVFLRGSDQWSSPTSSVAAAMFLTKSRWMDCEQLEDSRPERPADGPLSADTPPVRGPFRRVASRALLLFFCGKKAVTRSCSMTRGTG